VGISRVWSISVQVYYSKSFGDLSWQFAHSTKMWDDKPLTNNGAIVGVFRLIHLFKCCGIEVEV
jgi:hypothetical protein